MSEATPALDGAKYIKQVLVRSGGHLYACEPITWGFICGACRDGVFHDVPVIHEHCENCKAEIAEVQWLQP